MASVLAYRRLLFCRQSNKREVSAIVLPRYTASIVATASAPVTATSAQAPFSRLFCNLLCPVRPTSCEVNDSLSMFFYASAYRSKWSTYWLSIPLSLAAVTPSPFRSVVADPRTPGWWRRCRSVDESQTSRERIVFPWIYPFILEGQWAAAAAMNGRNKIEREPCKLYLGTRWEKRVSRGGEGRVMAETEESTHSNGRLRL